MAAKIDTISYYNENAQRYYEDTKGADLSDLYARFLLTVPTQGHILDLGCGSGRDSRYFLDQGYSVTAMDGSKELCTLASELLGQEVHCLLYDAITFEEEFDAVWACASLLHIPKIELPQILKKIHRSLQKEGILYASFKYGTSERAENGRFFSDFTEETLESLFAQSNYFHLQEIWTSEDVRPGREPQKWINLIARKISSMRKTSEAKTE